MNLRVFQSDKGDCVLLTSARGKRILADGGMSASYSRHVAPELGKLRRAGQKLDVVYVSHIDQDHISGILKMMNDAVEWRVYGYHQSNGNRSANRPGVPQPPDVNGIWHNAFHEQVGQNAGPIEDMLAATSTILSGAINRKFREIGQDHRDLASSTGEAIQLSRRVGRSQLNIPLNRPAQGKLMMVRPNRTALTLGDLSVYVIGPFEEDLKNLRKEWNQWLKQNSKQLKGIQDRAKRDEDRLAGNAVDRLIQPMLREAKELGAWQIALAKILGLRSEVTTPNLASLMLLVEEGNKSALLTGDGHADDIVKGLGHCGKLDPSGGLHVDVLKVQHHGSENNTHERFAKAITADHYVFCGNGAHENPDLDVVELFMNSRLQEQNGRGFKLWFNSASSASTNAKNNAHMREVEKLVRRFARSSRGRLKYQFLKKDHFDLTI